MEDFDDDDFGYLYTDVEVQATSAINSMSALTQFPLEEKNSDSSEGNERIAGGGGGGDNAKEEEEEAAVALEERQDWDGDELESESKSESEDDLNIVLNDHEEDGNGKLGFQVGRNGGGLDSEDEIGIEAKDEGNNGMENDDGGSCGGGGGLERGSGGKGRCSGGGYSAGFKHMRSQPSALLSNPKSNGSARVASYSSMFVKGNWEDNCCSLPFGKNSLGAQSGHNFSLPRSRTIVDVNIDALERKPWRHPGADITDFFNFGLNEDSWKSYCSSLFRYREQAIKSNPAYKSWRNSKQHEVLWVEGTETTTLSKQTRAVSPSREVSCREEQLDMPKGKTIQVENGIGERQPSVDIRHPVERDSDVIIQIPVQDMEEELSSSQRVAFDQGSSHVDEASDDGESGYAGANDGDMLCFSSASEDELPILEGPTEETVISIPERCSKHPSPCACNPVCWGSDNCGSIQVSDADECHNEELANGDSNETAEADRSSDDPNKCIGSVKSVTASTIKEFESSNGEESQCVISLLPSPSHDLESRHGIYVEPDKFYDHSKRASPNSESELHESVTFDYHSLKNSQSHSIKMRSGGYEYFARNRSPIQRNLKFHQRKASRVSKFKSHLDYEDAFYLSDSEKFNDLYNSRIEPHDQRNRHHGFHFSKRQGFSYYEGSEHSIRHRGKKFCDYHSGDVYSGNSHQRGERVSGYERDQCYSWTVNGKRHHPEQRIPRFSDDRREKDLNHYEGGDSVQGMEYLDFHGPRELILEQSRFLGSGIHTRWKWKSAEQNFRRRVMNDNFISECNYSNDMTEENCRSIQYKARERDLVQHKYDRQLQYGRGEVKSPVRSRRRYDCPLSGCETICCRNYEDEKSRNTRGQLSFCSYKEPRTVRRVREPGAPLSRIDIFEGHRGHRKHNCVARYSGSRGSCAGVVDNDENIKNPDDQDDFAQRRQHPQSEVLGWREEKCSFWYPDHNFQAEGTLYPNKTSKCGRSDAKHGSGRGGKLIDHREPEPKRYKLSREGHSDSKFLENCYITHRDNAQRTLPRNQDTTDKDMVVWDRKSPRCSEAGSLMCYGRYEYLDWNDNSEQRTLKNLSDSRLEKVVQADNEKTGTFLADANWCNKVPDSKRNDSPDIEEGQIVPEDFNEKPTERICSSKDRTNIIGTKSISRENPRILEIIAKMEKRRERFKEPISSKIVAEKNGKPFAGKVAETVEIKQLQRPARKRKWVGS